MPLFVPPANSATVEMRALQKISGYPTLTEGASYNFTMNITTPNQKLYKWSNYTIYDINGTCVTYSKEYKTFNRSTGEEMNHCFANITRDLNNIYLGDVKFWGAPFWNATNLTWTALRYVELINQCRHSTNLDYSLENTTYKGVKCLNFTHSSLRGQNMYNRTEIITWADGLTLLYDVLITFNVRGETSLQQQSVQNHTVGKLEEWENYNFSYPDTTNPSVSISSPSEGETVTSGTVTAEWAGSDNVKIDHYEVRLDNGEWVATNKTVHEFNVTEGKHTIMVKAIDIAGNTNRDSVTFTVVAEKTVQPSKPLWRQYWYFIPIAVVVTLIAIAVYWKKYRSMS